MKKIASVLALLAHCGAFAADANAALSGCWRSQQVQMTFADKTHRDQNADCAVEYDGQFARSRCYAPAGVTETLSAYQSIGQNKLRITPLDPSTRQAKGTPLEIRYRLEDDWLMIEREFPIANAGAAASKQPLSLKSVSVRVRAQVADQSGYCSPRGENAIRVGKTSTSSLALGVPPGWKAVLVDPVNNDAVRLAVDTSFFIGAFAPLDTPETGSPPPPMVLILDDVRYGPLPVRAKDFVAVKRRFAAELGGAKLTCDEPDRVCASLADISGPQVYTELLNINGRVAMVTSASVRRQEDSLPALRKSVQVFVEQLRLDNAN